MPSVHVRASRKLQKAKKLAIVIERNDDGEWTQCDLASSDTLSLLPTKVVGYTSGGNETLSLPFLLSRSGYADEVTRQALNEHQTQTPVPDTRLMLIDYGTHLEVLVSNLLLGAAEQRESLLEGAGLKELHSFRCIVQLAHSAISKVSAQQVARSNRKGVQLTSELEAYLDQLKRCATCYHIVEKTETYTFDFFVDGESRKAFSAFWSSSLQLYAALHKLSMLNDLAIPKVTRDRFKRETKSRRFASRLPEPQDENKVFRFERVNFRADGSEEIVDYVSLSDGEHQLAQLLGTFAMVSFPNVLFLLDEPESHFNPQWRVKFISHLMDLPGPQGCRRDSSVAAQQDALITTHSPFLPSDMSRRNVLVFAKGSTGEVEVRRPEIETYGATFDSILSDCFGVRPPMSDEPKREIEALLMSSIPEEIQAGMDRLGYSVEKALLADRLRQLLNKDS